MSHAVRVLSSVLLTVLLTLAGTPGQAAGQSPAPTSTTITGRILDQDTSEPVRDVTLRVRGTNLIAVSGDDGRFQLKDVPGGTQVLEMAHLAYGEVERIVLVESARDNQLSLRLPRKAVALAPVVVEAKTELEQRRISTGHSMNEIQRPEIEQASMAGVSLAQLIQNGLIGVNVRIGSGSSTCVEYRGSISDDGSCKDVSIVLDGVPVSVPGMLYMNMPISEIERIELMSPGEAGAIYGTSAGNGVLLIETRRGIRPSGPAKRNENLLGFDSDFERRPYSWMKVAGASILGNALGLGVSVLAAEKCFRTVKRESKDNYPAIGLTHECNAPETMIMGFVTFGTPAAIGSLLAREAGKTEISSGRFLPGFIMGSLLSAGGYMMWIHGGAREIKAIETAGLITLAVGTPILLTLTDFRFRLLR
jgi:hypothetical protein